jgi:enamine deaminase RidA (YjgF/YER057c/UK114 family)
VSRTACSTVFRRFAGPAADELAILCRPEGRSPDPVRQAEAVYRAFADLLAAQRTSFHDLTVETLFLRDIRRDLPLILGVRRQVLADLGQNVPALLPRFIQQAPADTGVSFELAAAAVIPRDRGTSSVGDFRTAMSCGCEGCSRSGARLVRLGDQVSLHTANLYGVGDSAFEQASDMFLTAERLLNQFDMGFHDVVRTWIHLRNIDRDYDALNKARRQFFRDHRIERRPASTGVQGVPLPDAHNFSMSLHAVRSREPIQIVPMSTPTLNEAWSYGVEFSRGLSVSGTNNVTLYVSGTASIDEAGQTVHVGHLESQVERMLSNITSLLAQRESRFEDLASGVIYVRNAVDAAVLRSMCRARGFTGFPCALVEASLCRPELLCEAEAVAILPLPRTGV